MAYINNEIYNQLSNDLRAMQTNVTNVMDNLGWFERGSDVGRFDKSFFEAKDGQSMGTKTYNINGQNIALEAIRVGVDDRTGAGQVKYIATLPDGQKVETTSAADLTHSGNYQFLNDIIKKSFGGEYENLNLGVNSGTTAENLKLLAEARNINPTTYEVDMKQPDNLQRIDYNTGLPVSGATGAGGTAAQANTGINLLSQIMADDRVKNDSKMQEWLRGNASLFDKLVQLGYNATDIINEAYAQTRFDKSAFTGDMTVMSAAENRAATKEAGYHPNTGGATGDTSGGTAGGGTAGSGTAGSGTDAPAGSSENNINDQLARLRDYIFNDPSLNHLSDTEKAFLWGTFGNNDDYTSGQTVPDNATIAQFIATAAEQAAADIDPYYQKISSQELEDYRNQMADIRNASQRFAQQEAASYKDTLTKTKQSLRVRGLTFSGINRGTLGKESAINYAGLEGTLPADRRMNWEDQMAGWQEKARDIGTAAERKLGSTTLGNELGLASPYDTSNLGPDNIADYQAGRTQALYTPHRAVDGYGYYAGLNEKPSEVAGTYTSQIELDRLKELELAKQARLAQYKLIS